ncbi:M3 family metallopeptidase [Dictyobacter formicarum]|uniref:Oligoendopeptidase F n=1 Tax=Dictyobacter formicarum TaxID=2778368 RepID=A0ABQ3V994_9CHLR|nr:M3 family metallopeptidase [Dictyobacter formicarum]GHO82414.1 oligoendopeptidase F [Dictyobacter formicarum]
MHIPVNFAPKNWQDFEPYYQALLHETLTRAHLSKWLQRGSELEKYVWEMQAGYKRARSRNIEDESARQAYQRFTDEIFAPFQEINHALQAKLLREMTWEPVPEHAEMIRRFQQEAAAYQVENVLLEREIAELMDRYFLVTNAIDHQCDEATPPQCSPEERWRIRQGCWRKARGQIDEIFLAMLSKRRQLASQAGFPTYTLYRWKQLNRSEYTPDEALAFHQTLAASILPVKTAWQQAHRPGRLRQPWEVEQAPLELIRPLPFQRAADLEAAMAKVFSRLDAEMGGMFERMRAGFLDVDACPGMLHGSEEWFFPIFELPCVRVFSNGTDEDVQLLMHECGHAWHDFLAYTHQDLVWQCYYPDEFAEFAAISMTYLATPFLFQDQGGFYPVSKRARFQAFLLYEPLRWLPYIACFDVFQHWLYTEAPEEVEVSQLDAKWMELLHQFEPDVNWSRYEHECAHGWQQDGRIFGQPFYMLEYALAHMGALQLYQQASLDHRTTWRVYREALTLGGTRQLSDLFQAAGADFPLQPGVVKSVAGFLAAQLRG